MKAVIEYKYPEPGFPYYHLPVFDCRPMKYGVSYISYLVSEHYNNREKEYLLSFPGRRIDGNCINSDSTKFLQDIELTDEQIRSINKMYFHMLDNPDLIESNCFI